MSLFSCCFLGLHVFCSLIYGFLLFSCGSADSSVKEGLVSETDGNGFLCSSVPSGRSARVSVLNLCLPSVVCVLEGKVVWFFFMFFHCFYADDTVDKRRKGVDVFVSIT